MTEDTINSNFKFSSYYKKIKFYIKLNIFLFSVLTTSFLLLIIPTIIGFVEFKYIILNLFTILFSVFYCNLMQRVLLKKFIISMNITKQEFSKKYKVVIRGHNPYIKSL